MALGKQDWQQWAAVVMSCDGNNKNQRVRVPRNASIQCSGAALLLKTVSATAFQELPFALNSCYWGPITMPTPTIQGDCDYDNLHFISF